MVSNTKLIEFRNIENTKSHEGYMGHLVPIEAKSDIPFAINRIYYITNVPEGQSRGFHSHNDLEQVLICLHGSVTVRISTPFEKEDIVLDRLNEGLYIGPMVWREMYDFTQDAVLLVLASKHYDEKDYIRDYSVYCKQAERYFKGGERI